MPDSGFVGRVVDDDLELGLVALAQEARHVRADHQVLDGLRLLRRREPPRRSLVTAWTHTFHDVTESGTVNSIVAEPSAPVRSCGCQNAVSEKLLRRAGRRGSPGGVRGALRLSLVFLRLKANRSPRLVLRESATLPAADRPRLSLPRPTSWPSARAPRRDTPGCRRRPSRRAGPGRRCRSRRRTSAGRPVRSGHDGGGGKPLLVSQSCVRRAERRARTSAGVARFG